MTSNPQIHFCPVCGFSKLTAPPYQQMPAISADIYKLQPPYSQYWGMGSYEVCPCCGFEFGADDEGIDQNSNSSFQDYLRFWMIEEKAQWFVPELKPINWDLMEQLAAAGIPIPKIKVLSIAPKN